MFIYVEDKDDTEIYLTFASTMPHKTRHLVFSLMEADEDSEFMTNMLNDFAHFGWSTELPKHTLGPLVKFPSLFGRIELTLYAKGSGTLDRWTDSESRKHLRNAKKVLTHYGFDGVPHRKLTIADLM